MATYKVIQDVEAEDKFVGPLTLKQFIFAMAGMLFGYLNVFAITKGAPWMMVFFAPPMLLGFFLAIPWSKEQSTEVWVLAKIRFRLKPKQRVWDQDGLQELVKITAPKKIERQLTNNMSENEVSSRLKALAETIDSRGWAVKNATLATGLAGQESDRLAEATILPKQVADLDAGVEDMLDTDSTVSANFDNMMQNSRRTHKEQTLENMERARRGEPVASPNQPEVHFTPPPQAQAMPTYSKLYSPAQEQALTRPEERQSFSALPQAPTIAPIPVAPVDEAALSQQLKERQSSSNIAYGHMRNLRAEPPAPASNSTVTDKPQAEMTTPSTPAIMNLAQNDDLSVATIARQAKKASREGSDEVVISLR